MKKLVIILGLFLLFNCSSTRFVDSWKNNEIESFIPKKMLVIGMTDNLTARSIFEEDLTAAFIKRNIYAKESSTVFDNGFTSSKKTEEEIDKMVKKLGKEGFDAIIITAVKGIEERESYLYDGYYKLGTRWAKFGPYYYRFQDIYYSPDYYEAYKVYHIETSIYNILKDEKSLVWVGSLDIVNPKKIASTVKGYVTAVILQLEKEKLIKKAH